MIKLRIQKLSSEKKYIPYKTSIEKFRYIRYLKKNSFMRLSERSNCVEFYLLCNLYNIMQTYVKYTIFTYIH